MLLQLDRILAEHLLQENLRVDRLDVDLRLRVRKNQEVPEQLTRELPDTVGLLGASFEILPLRIGEVGVLHAEQLQIRDQRSERSPDIVGERGDQLPVGLQRMLRAARPLGNDVVHVVDVVGNAAELAEAAFFVHMLRLAAADRSHVFGKRMHIPRKPARVQQKGPCKNQKRHHDHDGPQIAFERHVRFVGNNGAALTVGKADHEDPVSALLQLGFGQTVLQAHTVLAPARPIDGVALIDEQLLLRLKADPVFQLIIVGAGEAALRDILLQIPRKRFVARAHGVFRHIKGVDRPSRSDIQQKAEQQRHQNAADDHQRRALKQGKLSALSQSGTPCPRWYGSAWDLPDHPPAFCAA